MKKVAFFPGKNTHLKRYISYFNNLILKKPEDGDDVKVILCHSRGLDYALQYCQRNNIKPLIVSMDGVQMDNIPKDIHVVNFRPRHKKNLGDESMYHNIIYYNIDEKISHYPYMNKHIRNKIIKELQLK